MRTLFRKHNRCHKQPERVTFSSQHDASAREQESSFLFLEKEKKKRGKKHIDSGWNETHPTKSHGAPWFSCDSFTFFLSPCVRRSQSWAGEHVWLNAAGYQGILAGTIQRPLHSAATRDRIPGWS